MRLILQFVCQFDRFAQCAEFTFAFEQFAFGIGFCDDARSCLKVQYVVPAEESADRDGLVQVAVETDIADAALTFNSFTA